MQIELHPFSPVVKLPWVPFLQKVFLQRLGILTPKSWRTVIIYGLVSHVVGLHDGAGHVVVVERSNYRTVVIVDEGKNLASEYSQLWFAYVVLVLDISRALPGIHYSSAIGLGSCCDRCERAS